MVTLPNSSTNVTFKVSIKLRSMLRFRIIMLRLKLRSHVTFPDNNVTFKVSIMSRLIRKWRIKINAE